RPAPGFSAPFGPPGLPARRPSPERERAADATEPQQTVSLEGRRGRAARDQSLGGSAAAVSSSGEAPSNVLRLGTSRELSGLEVEDVRVLQPRRRRGGTAERDRGITPPHGLERNADDGAGAVVLSDARVIDHVRAPSDGVPADARAPRCRIVWQLYLNPMADSDARRRFARDLRIELGEDVRAGA